MNIVKKTLAAATLAATALVTSTPAMAEHRDGRGNDTAAIAIGVGILGLAIGAIAASGKRDRWDDRYYVGDGWYYDDDYYYNRAGKRYHRGEWQRRYGYNHNRRDWNRHYHGNRDWNREYRGSRGDWNRHDRRRGGDNRYYERRGY